MKKLLLILGFIGSLLIVYLTYSGMFAKPEIDIRLIQPFYIIYTKHIGPYQASAKPILEVHNYLLSNDITPIADIGIYYDDPMVINEKDLRSLCGSIVTKENIKTLKKLDSKYKLDKYPGGETVYATFPLKNIFSIMFGAIKTYPAMKDFMSNIQYQMPYIETYWPEKGEINYIASPALKPRYFNKLIED